MGEWGGVGPAFLQSEIVFKLSPNISLKLMLFISGFSLIYITAKNC